MRELVQGVFLEDQYPGVLLGAVAAEGSVLLNRHAAADRGRARVAVGAGASRPAARPRPARPSSGPCAGRPGPRPVGRGSGGDSRRNRRMAGCLPSECPHRRRGRPLAACGGRDPRRSAPGLYRPLDPDARRDAGRDLAPAGPNRRCVVGGVPFAPRRLRRRRRIAARAAVPRRRRRRGLADEVSTS